MKLKVVKPALKPEEIEKAVHPIIKEYLEHGDSEETAVCSLKLLTIVSKSNICSHSLN